jgi:hypothetical protein
MLAGCHLMKQVKVFSLVFVWEEGKRFAESISLKKECEVDRHLVLNIFNNALLNISTVLKNLINFVEIDDYLNIESIGHKN